MNGIATTGALILFYLLSATGFGQRAFSDEMLRNPKSHSQQFEGMFELRERGIYEQTHEPGRVLLENGYAQYHIANPDEWPLQGERVKPVAVTVIFTKYPKNKEFWLTDYHWLLARRLRELFALDSNLNAADIEYSLLLQTDCDNEFEAMQLFHGIEVSYVPLAQPGTRDKIPGIVNTFPPPAPPGPTAPAAERRNASSIKKIRQLMQHEEYYMDSTVFLALERNRQWKNAMLVLDWTGSMYGHGAEALLWQAINEDSSGMEMCAFFNDGDRKKNIQKVAGYTGGIYVEDAKPVSQPVRLMRKVQNKGNGGDSPENDLEALITAMSAAPHTQDLVLVADNNSCIRDFILLRHLDRPVHIILCGTAKGINHQYLNLAWRTGGSIHTKNLDLENIHDLVTRDALVIDGVKYIVTADNRLMPVDRANNFFAHCDRYYKAPRKQKKGKWRDPKCYFTE